VDRIGAYLDGVEDDSEMIVLDLFSEAEPQWNRTQSYFGKKWVWCLLHGISSLGCQLTERLRWKYGIGGEFTGSDDSATICSEEHGEYGWSRFIYGRPRRK